MKVLDRILALIFNACLLLSVGIGSALGIASTPAYYHWQFEVTGVYASVDENGVETPQYIPCIDGNEKLYAQFTNEQLDEIAQHIIDYLFSDQDSFALVMDDVILNGVLTDDVNIFGDVAVKHMVDVKVLMKTLSYVGVACGAFCAFALVYFLIRALKGQGGFLFKYTLIFYGVFLGLLLAFCAYNLVQTLSLGLDLQYFTYVLWMNFHFIIFPDPSQAMGSFFNDTLTMILTLDLFMAAVLIVLALLGASLVVWGWLSRRLDRHSRLAQAKIGGQIGE